MKYPNDYSEPENEILNNIANELAEANRLKRLELEFTKGQYLAEVGRGGELEDRA